MVTRTLDFTDPHLRGPERFQVPYGGHLVRTAIGLGAAIGECRETLVGVAQQPTMNGSAVDPVAGGDVCDRGTDVCDRGTVEHLPDGVVALLNHRKLHQHDEVLPGSGEHK